MIEIDFNKYPFPARTRHHTNPSYYIPLKDLKFVPKFYPMPIEKIEWSKIFINSKSPQMLDIGCGRGLFLLTVAAQNPDTNVLGIEVREWCCEWLRNYITSENIENCGILRYCVGNGLQFIETATIKEIYYLFPDPWVKNKHRKRRAFNLELLEEIYRLLNEGGKLYLATDLLEVHKYHLKTLEKFTRLEFAEISNDEIWNKPLTNKEIFCIKENIKYYRIIAKKL